MLAMLTGRAFAIDWASPCPLEDHLPTHLIRWNERRLWQRLEQNLDKETFVKKIYSFEIPSSTEWNFTNDKKYFRPNLYCNINDTVKSKVEALKQYKSELRKWPHPRSLKAINLSLKKNGSVIGCNYAEAFVVGRIIT